ncbi:MAG: Thymidylate kinase [Chlamydiae bacterium]|nr:Thymidylate kinase [Chlamydiota bacterium]
MTNKPYIVELIGIDGSGKSTVSIALNEKLKENMIQSQSIDPLNEKSEFTKEILKIIKQIDKDEVSFHEYSESFLAFYFSISFFIRFNKLIDAQSEVVICDRYYNSHFVSQLAFGVDLDYMKPLFQKLPAPDSLILLDVPVSVAQERLGQRKTHQSHENLDYLNKSRDLYLELLNQEKGFIVDATQPVEIVVDKCFEIIESSNFANFDKG